MKKKMGRPSLFTEEFLELILDEISEGSTERACFRVEGRPAWRNWCKFKRDNPDFRHRLACANDDWCVVYESEIYKIAMDETKDIIPYEERTASEKHGLTVKTGATSDNTAVQRHKLQIDTIKNLMKWKMPEKYGDKVLQEHTGSVGHTIAIELATKETK